VTVSFAFLPNIGPLEVAIVLLIVLIIFGPKRIPAAFRSVGDALRGFRDTVGGEDEEDSKPAALTGSPETGGEKSGTGGESSGSGEKSAATAGKSGSGTET
jgi:sec-independent protein translocase protein TatA